jgi:hypothetical protein
MAIKKQRAALLLEVDKEVGDAMRRYPRLRLMYLREAAFVKLILSLFCALVRLSSCI